MVLGDRCIRSEDTSTNPDHTKPSTHTFSKSVMKLFERILSSMKSNNNCHLNNYNKRMVIAQAHHFRITIKRAMTKCVRENTNY